MSRSIRYGIDSTCQFDVPDESIVADCSWTNSVPLDDPAAAVSVALDDPIDFPPLHQAIVSGDRIAVALSPHVPQASAIVAGVLQSLLRTCVELDTIQLVVSCQTSKSDLKALEDSVPAGVEIVIHDPSNRQSLAFLTSSRLGNAIYVNRTLHEADVVLPIGCVRLDSERGSLEVDGDLFPTFSDEETQQRFLHTRDDADALSRFVEEAAEASWLLGVHLMIQVIPASGDAVLHVLAGEARTVADKSRSLCNEAWRVRLSRRASLVIASLPGGVDEQTWENFSRALRNASRAVSDDGAIVLCTEISSGYTPFLREEESQFEPDDETDGGEVAQLVSVPSISLLEEIRERHHVYLLSQLEEDVVEDLGMGFVARADQISHLARQHDSCILLGNAQRIFVECTAE